MIVVNRSSNLSWMISEWFFWSWNMHRLVLIYLSTHLFIYCLKELSNVNLKKKRDVELQKPIAHTSIWLGKRERWKLYDARQRLTHQIEISKISGIDLIMRCIDSNILNDIMYMEPNEKLLSYVIKFCGRSYMHISIIEMCHII